MSTPNQHTYTVILRLPISSLTVIFELTPFYNLSSPVYHVAKVFHSKSSRLVIFLSQVADFGLAKLTENRIGTAVVGTFGYMSPEYVSFCSCLITVLQVLHVMVIQLNV